MYVALVQQMQVDANRLQAEECLTDAWNLCHKNAIRNKE